MNPNFPSSFNFSLGDELRGEIVGLASGGQGIIRHAGFVIFVPFTAPGDLISCRIVKKKKNYADAELIEIHHPSVLRATPPCPYYGRCGGCQLQHLNDEAQLEYKKLWVEESLKRIGKLPMQVLPPVVPATMRWGYRRHITLSLKPENGAFIAGYIAVDNHSLVKVSSCPIFTSEKDNVIQHVQSFAQMLQSHPGDAGKVAIIKHVEGHCLLNVHFNRLPTNYVEACENTLARHSQSYCPRPQIEVLTCAKAPAVGRSEGPQYYQYGGPSDRSNPGALAQSKPQFMAAGSIAGIVVNSPGKQFSFGETTLTLKVDDLTFLFSPQVFVQNHPEQSMNIYQTICRLAKDSKFILDLYCGIGVSSVLLAKQGADVLGVESNAESVRLAKVNAENNTVSNVRFLQADVEQVIKERLQRRAPDLAIVNPPRIGLSNAVVKALLENGPAEIIYISCMPSTLARDLQALCAERYRLSSCQAFDMFPQTAHIETVVCLKRDLHGS